MALPNPEKQSGPSKKATSKPSSDVTRIPILVIGLALLVLGLVFVVWRVGAGPTSVVTSGVAPDTTVITTPGRLALGSDVIDSFFLGAGLVLMLVGVLYPRITGFGFAGASVQLAPKVAGAIAKRTSDQDKAERAWPIAMAILATNQSVNPANPPAHAIDSAAETALSALDRSD